MYMYAFVCLHCCTSLFVYCTHTCVPSMSICICICVCMYMCTCVYVYVCVCVFTLLPSSIRVLYTHVCSKYIYMYLYMCTYVYVYMCICVCVRLCVYIAALHPCSAQGIQIGSTLLSIDGNSPQIRLFP